MQATRGNWYTMVGVLATTTCPHCPPTITFEDINSWICNITIATFTTFQHYNHFNTTYFTYVVYLYAICTMCWYVVNIDSTVGRSIAVYQTQGKYTAEVRYRGYWPTIFYILCSNVSMRQTNLLPKKLFLKQRIFVQSQYHIYQTTSQCLSSNACTITVSYVQLIQATAFVIYVPGCVAWMFGRSNNTMQAICGTTQWQGKCTVCAFMINSCDLGTLNLCMLLYVWISWTSC